MKIATSVTVFNDSVGTRMSYTYSEVAEDGTIVSDNNRRSKVLTEAGPKALAAQLLEYAQDLLEG